MPGPFRMMEDPMFTRTTTALAIFCLLGGISLTQAADKPTDPQIAHIAYTAGTIDIEVAKLAIEKSKNKDVMAFANDMVRDHEAVNNKHSTLSRNSK